MKYNLRVQARTGGNEKTQTGGFDQKNLNIINFVSRNDRKIVISWLIKAKRTWKSHVEVNDTTYPKNRSTFFCSYICWVF